MAKLFALWHEHYVARLTAQRTETRARLAELWQERHNHEDELRAAGMRLAADEAKPQGFRRKM